jgi:hypothetical protein
MNTPRKIKRHSPLPFNPHARGHFALNASNPEIAVPLSILITEFVHLEAMMERVLSVLLGTDDVRTVGYVYRAIISPKGRQDLMQQLLTLAPINQRHGGEYDEILAEFRSLNLERNKYAHGKWWTHIENGESWLSSHDQHGFGLGAAHTVKADDLDPVIRRIRGLVLDIYEITDRDLEKIRDARKPPPKSQSQVP